MVRKLDCVVVCDVFVPAGYTPKLFTFADMSNGFVYGIFRCKIALFSFLGFGRI